MSALTAALCVAAGATPLANDAGASPAPKGPGAGWPDRESLTAHAVDVADYTLRATLDPIAHTVHGDGVIRWRNDSETPARELWIHLYLNAFKNERSTFLRERVGGRGSSPAEDWGFIDVRRLSLLDASGVSTDLLPNLEIHRPDDDDETDARVPLPRAVAPGEIIEVAVTFDDKLPRVVERTGYVGSFHMVGQWFPKMARLERDGRWAHFPFHHLSEFYADFGTYDVTVDVPEAFAIAATGPVVEEHVDHGRRVQRRVQRDIHDFAFAAWDKWQTAHETVDGVDVSILYPSGFQSIAERELAAIAFALPYDSARYGRYPYGVLTIVHPEREASEAGGMEYPTLITSEGPWWTPRGVLAPEIVTVHELGHQWFYGLVATDEASFPFLDEGINQYAETDTMAAWKGAGSAADLLGIRVSDGALQAVSSNRAVYDEPVAQAASSFSTGASYGELVYARTAAVLETMSRVYGPDALGAALGVYTRRFRFAHPLPSDFLAVIGEGLGPSAESNLRAALYDKGWVDYVADSVWSRHTTSPAGTFDGPRGREKTEAVEAEGWEGSVLVRRRGTLVFPVDVDLVFADGTTRREAWSGEGDFVRIPFRGPSAAIAVRVDPENRITIDSNPLNNVARAQGAPRAAPHALEQLAYFAQLALQAIIP